MARERQGKHARMLVMPYGNLTLAVGKRASAIIDIGE
jgi:hypothetical protein